MTTKSKDKPTGRKAPPKPPAKPEAPLALTIECEGCGQSIKANAIGELEPHKRPGGAIKCDGKPARALTPPIPSNQGDKVADGVARATERQAKARKAQATPENSAPKAPGSPKATSKAPGKASQAPKPQPSAPAPKSATPKVTPKAKPAPEPKPDEDDGMGGFEVKPEPPAKPERKAPQPRRPVEDSRLPPVGSVLKCRHKGVEHQVKRLAGGYFEFAGKSDYTSLSTIGEVITGSKTNGYKLFGLGVNVGARGGQARPASAPRARSWTLVVVTKNGPGLEHADEATPEKAIEVTVARLGAGAMVINVFRGRLQDARIPVVPVTVATKAA